jgi:hypothetical protein
MKTILFLGALSILSSPAFAQTEEVPHGPYRHEGGFELNIGFWDTQDADEGFYFSFGGRVAVDDRLEIVFGAELANGVGTDLISYDPLDCSGTPPSEFDVSIYGVFMTVMVTPTPSRRPGALRLAVGGGGGFYLAEFTEYGDWWFDELVDSDVSFGTHAVGEIEWIYSDVGWFKLQARRIWLDFEPQTFILPSGLGDVSDFSGWQISIGWGLMF